MREDEKEIVKEGKNERKGDRESQIKVGKGFISLIFSSGVGNQVEKGEKGRLGERRASSIPSGFEKASQLVRLWLKPQSTGGGHSTSLSASAACAVPCSSSDLAPFGAGPSESVQNAHPRLRSS